jgi:hypothetical protein
VACASAVTARQATGPPLRKAVLVLQVLHHLSFDSGLHQFFDSTSLRAMLSSACSATIRFELGVFGFKLAQPLRVTHAHATKLAFQA